MARDKNEWGIPDWHNATAYGDVEAWPLYRWEWEFLRRREDYRADFDKFAQPTYERELKQRLHMKNPQKYAKYTPEEVAYLRAKLKMLPAPLKPDQPGFCAMDFNDKDFSFYRKYGLYALFNPRIGQQPDSFLRRFEEPELPCRCGRDVANLRKKPIDSMPIWDGQMAILFNLDKPFSGQIDEAKKRLKHAQKTRHGKPTQRRRHPTKWLGYLRALDGREAGASWAEMTETFFAQGLLDRREDPSGGYQPPPLQAARDKWDAATALCFNF